MNDPAKDPVVIVSAIRTPLGSLQGSLKTMSATQLGSAAIAAALAASGQPAQNIDEVIMGCVLQAGLGQAPARQAAIGANLPASIPCTTVSKVCGSGLKALMLAHDSLMAGSANTIIAGGMESMSNAPHLLLKARDGYRLGSAELTDHMFLDGLQDAYDKGKLMGVFAENTATHFGFTREQQDAYALRSLERAQAATNNGIFTREIAPLTIESKKGDIRVTIDEQILHARPEKIPTLKPAFANPGTVTAANSSSISDGAAALMLMRESQAKKCGLAPLARIIAHTSFAADPAWFSTAPIFAISKLLEKTGWQKNDVDLFEINEAFAVVALAAIKELQLPPEKVNIHGGACALGHPIGASGARIMVTLLNALATHNLTKGIATLCIGGGEAVAMAVERIPA